MPTTSQLDAWLAGNATALATLQASYDHLSATINQMTAAFATIDERERSTLRDLDIGWLVLSGTPVFTFLVDLADVDSAFSAILFVV